MLEVGRWLWRFEGGCGFSLFYFGVVVYYVREDGGVCGGLEFFVMVLIGGERLDSVWSFKDEGSWGRCFRVFI